MTRALVLSLAVSLSSCAFAVKRPALTAGIVGGSIALGTCEIGTDFDGEHATCGLVTLGTAVVLGGIVWLAMLAGGEGNTVLNDQLNANPDPEVPQDPTLDQPPPPEPAPAPAPAPAPPPSESVEGAP